MSSDQPPHVEPFDNGGILPRGMQGYRNDTGEPIPVIDMSAERRAELIDEAVEDARRTHRKALDMLRDLSRGSDLYDETPPRGILGRLQDWWNGR